MFCPFGGLAHDLGVWRRKNGEYQNPCCGPGIETSPNKIKPYFGKLWKTQWSLQIHGSWRPFWEGSGPFTKSRPSIFWVIHLSSMMKFPLHLWGSGYDSVSNCPYKIKGKNACFWGTTPWFCKGNCQGYYIYISTSGWKRIFRMIHRGRGFLEQPDTAAFCRLLPAIFSDQNWPKPLRVS